MKWCHLAKDNNSLLSNALNSNSLSSHECVPVGQTENMCSLLQNKVSESVGSRSDGGKEFHSLGAQAAKLRGPKLDVRQASTCKSP